MPALQTGHPHDRTGQPPSEIIWVRRCFVHGNVIGHSAFLRGWPAGDGVRPFYGYQYEHPLLGYIDNGRFFREPFRWLYVIFAVLNLLFPIFILAKVIEMDFFKYAEGKLILAFILLFIILCAGAWGSYLLWMNRKNKLKEAIQEENEFIAIPVVSHLTQTMGEWLGLYIGVIGTLCSVVIAIFAANEIRYILPIPSGMFFLMPIYGFLIVVFARLLAELYRALAVIANNTRKLTKTEAKAEAKLEDIEDIEEI